MKGIVLKAKLEPLLRLCQAKMNKNHLKQVMSQLGRKGGRTTKKRHGKDHFRKAGKLGAEKRWKKLSTTE